MLASMQRSCPRPVFASMRHSCRPGVSKYVVYIEVCPIPKEYVSRVHCAAQVCPDVGLQ